jgi:lipoprotein-releasing system ATP-binding protein
MNDCREGSSPVLACHHLVKTYREGPEVLHILNDISFSVAPGERLAITGASGSGKTTLLNLLGGLDRPDSGSVLIRQQDMARLNESGQGRLRNETLGFVFQFHHLLGEFTALENVAMPLLIRKRFSVSKACQQAASMLEVLGLGQRLAHKPGQLSGGERQRVAIARAMVTQPDCLLMDEPTGNLDQATATRIESLILEVSRQLDTAFIIVTHDVSLAGQLDRELRLENGVLKQVAGR